MASELSILNQRPTGLAPSPAYFKGAALAAGTAIGFGIVAPSSALGYMATTIGSLAVSRIAYAVGAGLHYHYDRRCHRIGPPLLIKPDTPQYERLLANTFERLKSHPYYEKFKEIQQSSSDPEIFSYLREHLKGGYCCGSAINFLSLINRDPKIPSFELLKALNIQEIFYLQCLHIMEKSFTQYEQAKWKELRSLPNCMLNAWRTASGLAPEGQDPKEPIIRKEIALAQEISKDLHTSLIPWKEIDTDLFSVKKSMPIFFHELIKSRGSFLGKVFALGDEDAHVIGIQGSAGKFRFYDTIGFNGGGLFEYDNVAEYCEALARQLIRYNKNPFVKLHIKSD